MSGRVVTIPREVAQVIESLKLIGKDNEGIIKVKLGAPVEVPLDTSELQSVPFDTLISALINGYEIELTEDECRKIAHDKIIKAYFDQREGRGQYDIDYANQAYADGIMDAITWLGVVVKGVNDDDR